MKKLLLLCLLANSAHAQITNPSPYCAAQATEILANYAGGGIRNVTLGPLNNSTPTDPPYQYYNNVASAILYRGQQYTLSIRLDTTLQTVPDNSYYTAYLDFNRNEIFQYPSDTIATGAALTTVEPLTYTRTFTIPMTANVGSSRIRVTRSDRTVAAGTNTYVAACSIGGNPSIIGETEDYNITIADMPAAPVCNFSANATTGLQTNTFALTDATTNNPTLWKWTITPNNVTYVLGTSTSKNISVKFTQDGLYTVKLRVSNAGGADSLTKTDYISIGANGVPELSTAEPALYPNPSTGIFYIGKEKIDLSNEPAGVYMRKINGKTYKLIKQ